MKHSLFNTIISSAVFLTLATGMQVSANAEDFQQALVAAYNTNPRLMAERARVREIDENYVQAQASGRLTINASGSAGLTRTETPASVFGGGVSDLKPRTAQLSIVQPLYQGGRVNGLKAQAKSGVLAARQGLRNTEQTVLLSAATAYLDVLRDEEAEHIRRNNVNVLTRQRFAAQDRFDVGEGTRTDIAQADARLAGAEIGQSQAEAQLAISRAAYMRYMGHAPMGLTVPPQYILPETLMQSQLQARSNNPQLVASRYNENAAQAAVYVAKSASRPTLALNGSLQGSRESSANVPRAESASITAQLRIPIFSGGLNRSRVRAAKHAKIRTKFETRETELAIDEAVANLWAQVVSSRRALDASKRQVAAAEIAFEGVELEQQVGTRNTLDVLDAEQELLNAKLTVVQAERNLNVASYQLLVTMGGFDAYSLQLPIDAYDPQRNFDAVTVSPYGKIIPGPLVKPLSEVGDLAGKVAKDTADLADMLIPDQVPILGGLTRNKARENDIPVSTDGALVRKVGRDVAKLISTAIPEPVGSGAVSVVKQIPDIPLSLLRIPLSEDVEGRNADPEDISPDPQLILLEIKPEE